MTESNDRLTLLFVSGQDVLALAGDDIPHSHRTVVRSRYAGPAIRGDRTDSESMTLEVMHMVWILLRRQRSLRFGQSLRNVFSLDRSKT